MGIESFPTDTVGYRLLADWFTGFGPVVRVGVEGTGSYGVGLSRHLHREGIVVVVVDRPNRQLRRRLGRSDPIDAEAAARAALSGEANVTPKGRDGAVEQIVTIINLLVQGSHGWPRRALLITTNARCLWRSPLSSHTTTRGLDGPTIRYQDTASVPGTWRARPADTPNATRQNHPATPPTSSIRHLCVFVRP